MKPKSIVACRVSSYGAFEDIACEHLAGLGIRHVEISVPPAGEIEATARKLERFGLTASTLHGECDVTRGDAAEQVANQMPAFAALGTKIMFVSAKAQETPLETVYARLRAAGDSAAVHGVTIALETHPDLISNGEVALRTMRGVNHPNVRVNFDTANIYFYNEGIDGVAELRKVLGFVAAVHLKESDGKLRSWHFPALGRGMVKFAETFEVLDNAGFAGPYTLEIEGIDGETRTERMVCDRVAESVGYLRGMGRM